MMADNPQGVDDPGRRHVSHPIGHCVEAGVGFGGGNGVGQGDWISARVGYDPLQRLGQAVDHGAGIQQYRR
jgi:hypothetical protein